ncbi:conserved hypothetical protein [Ricinus communis]|uniref:Uncharacterized protein n=1 Tax=Ricinus communis TaxID=3988 RepID=B9TBD6_RICCO|nr:conserved hypothetical protein [Ricinus communis]
MRGRIVGKCFRESESLIRALILLSIVGRQDRKGITSSMGNPNPGIPSKLPTDPSTSETSDLLLPGWLLGGVDGKSFLVRACGLTQPRAGGGVVFHDYDSSITVHHKTIPGPKGCRASAALPFVFSK